MTEDDRWVNHETWDPGLNWVQNSITEKPMNRLLAVLIILAEFPHEGAILYAYS